MKARSRLGLWLGIGVTVGLWLALGVASRSGQSLTHAGWKVRVLGASYGTEHFGPPQSWNRVKSAMPTRLMRWIGLGRPRPARFSAPHLVIWIETCALGEEVQSTGEFRFEWGDTVGLRGSSFRFLSELEVAQASGWTGIRREQNRLRRALVTKVYPRRVERLPLAVSRVSGSGAISRLGDLTIANPRPQSFGSWEEEVLPVLREAGGLTVELRRFDVAATVGSDGLRWAGAVLQISRDGVAAGGWGVNTMELSDPTGNHAVYGAGSNGQILLPLHSQAAEDGCVHLQFPWMGWGSEPVWEMTLLLQPIGIQALDSGDPSAVLSGIRVPSEDGLVSLGREVSLGGIEVNVLGLAGAHSGFPGRARDIFGQLTLEMELPPLPAGRHLAVVATGERGASLPPGRPLGDRGETVSLDVPESVELMDVGLVLHPERRVRFRVGE